MWIQRKILTFSRVFSLICYNNLNHMRIKDLNIPNILSLSRVALSFVFVILLFKSYEFLAAGVFCWQQEQIWLTGIWREN